MAFTVQDDTGLITGANAYISEAFADTYHSDRGNTAWAAEMSAAKQIAIVRATDYLDLRFRYVGERLYHTGQSTEWPRNDAYDVDDDQVLGIPPEIQEATAEYALVALSQSLVTNPDRDDTGRAVQAKTEKVGPISESVEYRAGAGFEMPKYPSADRKLFVRGLILQRGILRRG